MTTVDHILEIEFRYRIFVSLGIALITCLVGYVFTTDQATIVERVVGASWGRTAGFALGALLCLTATLLRMSAGTVLRSGRVMSFDVRPEQLFVLPPYTLVRNPIYCADLIAATGISLAMPVSGLLYPLLLAMHYRNLVAVEERTLGENHSDAYAEYCRQVPRLVPRVPSMIATVRRMAECSIDADGARYNALYLLFVPGLLISCVTGQFFHAVIIGLPGVADWAVWHTLKGLHHTSTPEAAS